MQEKLDEVTAALAAKEAALAAVIAAGATGAATATAHRGTAMPKERVTPNLYLDKSPEGPAQPRALSPMDTLRALGSSLATLFMKPAATSIAEENDDESPSTRTSAVRV